MFNYEHSILKKLEKKRQYAAAQEGVLGGFWRGVSGSDLLNTNTTLPRLCEKVEAKLGIRV